MNSIPTGQQPSGRNRRTTAHDLRPTLHDLRFSGYLRPDGQVGIRNRLLVLFTVVCAEEVSRRVAMHLDDAVVAGWRDCMVSLHAQQKMLRLAANPNVGAVLVMSLGCECTDAPEIAQAVAEMGKPVSLVSIQAAGGTRAAIEQAVERGRALMSEPFERREITVADLIVGVECGGSDTTSGLAANPALGLASDAIVEAGGTVVFEETNELLGCEDALTRQAATPAIAAEITAAIHAARRWGVRTGQRAISAGNIEGGLTTIEEKSLGAVCKAGSTPVRSVLHGGRWERPSAPGLHLLAPFYVEEEGWTGAGTISDPNGVTELAACGAHLVVFTTGRGTVTGSGIVPVIKVCGNPETYARMSDNMDINAGAIVSGEKTLSQVGEDIVEAIVRTANGDLTRAEELGHFEFHI
ncbi:MAG: UxaA family hydrolase [Thermomicrobiales bacterium]